MSDGDFDDAFVGALRDEVLKRMLGPNGDGAGKSLHEAILKAGLSVQSGGANYLPHGTVSARRDLDAIVIDVDEKSLAMFIDHRISMAFENLYFEWMKKSS